MHLRVADLLADLPLREVLHEAQLEHLTLDLRQRGPRAGDRLTVLDELVRGVVVAEQVDQRGRLVLVTARRCIERGGLVARSGLLGLQDLLHRAAEVLGHLAYLG